MEISLALNRNNITNLEKMLLNSFYKPKLNDNKLAESSKKLRKILADYVYSLKRTAKEKYDEYCNLRPQEVAEELERIKEEKIKIKKEKKELKEKEKKEKKEASDVRRELRIKKKQKEDEDFRQYKIKRRKEQGIPMGLINRRHPRIAAQVTIRDYENNELDKLKKEYKEIYGNKRKNSIPMPTIWDIRSSKRQSIAVDKYLVDYYYKYDCLQIVKWRNKDGTRLKY